VLLVDRLNNFNSDTWYFFISSRKIILKTKETLIEQVRILTEPITFYHKFVIVTLV